MSLQPSARSAPITIASVPSGHVYVRHLSPEGGGGPRRLPDPDPSHPERPAGRSWWPPAMLEPDWILNHDVDLMHLHFGFDARTPAQLASWIDALVSRGVPLVQTVHDLRNPHHEDRDLHDRQLDVLIPAAAELITLTPGAAREIERRWDRPVTVIAHPHVVGLSAMAALARVRATRPPGPFRVGLHLKSLRPNIAPLTLLPTLVDAVAALPDAVLQVNIHHDVLVREHDRYDAGLARYLSSADERGLLQLRVHRYFSDDDLFDYLNDLDVSVLPYRFGTHSGWLEACRDLGTTVVAPTCGYYAEQGAVLSYVHDEHRFGRGSLIRAIATAHADGPACGASATHRRTQRAVIARSHDRVYAAALAGPGLDQQGPRCASV